jgi:hypothetical protein
MIEQLHSYLQMAQAQKLLAKVINLELDKLFGARMRILAMQSC